MRRRASAQTAAAAAADACKAADEGPEALEQPLLKQMDEVTAAQAGAADAAVIITAARAMPLAQLQAAAGDAGALEEREPTSLRPEQPGVLSAFVQAALLQSAQTEGTCSAADGECCCTHWLCLSTQGLLHRVVTASCASHLRLLS
jgi:hypothetical protein